MTEQGRSLSDGFCPRDHGCSLPARHKGKCSLTAALCVCPTCEAGLPPIDWQARALAAEQALTEARSEAERLTKLLSASIQDAHDAWVDTCLCVCASCNTLSDMLDTAVAALSSSSPGATESSVRFYPDSDEEPLVMIDVASPGEPTDHDAHAYFDKANCPTCLPGEPEPQNDEVPTPPTMCMHGVDFLATPGHGCLDAGPLTLVPPTSPGETP